MEAYKKTDSRYQFQRPRLSASRLDLGSEHGAYLGTSILEKGPELEMSSDIKFWVSMGGA